MKKPAIVKKELGQILVYCHKQYNKCDSRGQSELAYINEAAKAAIALITDQQKQIEKLEAAKVPILLAPTVLPGLPIGTVVWRECRWTDSDGEHLELEPVMRSRCCGTPVMVDGKCQTSIQDIITKPWEAENEYKIRERYWSARPTEDQMEGVPWP